MSLYYDNGLHIVLFAWNMSLNDMRLLIIDIMYINKRIFIKTAYFYTLKKYLRGRDYITASSQIYMEKAAVLAFLITNVKQWNLVWSHTFRWVSWDRYTVKEL